MKIISLLFSSVPVLFLLASCGSSKEESPAAKVRFGLFPNVTHAQGLVARHASRTGQGWIGYEKYLGERIGRPVSIQWYSYNAGPSAMEAMFAGALDFTYVGPGPAINAYAKSRGALLQIIAGSVQGGSALVVPEDSTAGAPEDFRGKVIATPQLGNTQDIACRAWLAKAGLTITQSGGDVRILPTPNPEQINLFRQKKIDAAWTVEPWVSRLESNAKGKILVDESEAITTVLTARREFMSQNPGITKAVIEAHRDLTRWILEHPEDAQKIVVEEIEDLTHSKIDPGLVKQAWKRLLPTHEISQKKLDLFVGDAAQCGFFKNTPDISDIVAPY